MKMYMISLGCAKNQVDSEMIVGFMQQDKENILVDNPEDADLLMVNTCAFIESAREEAINTILEFSFLIEKRFKACCFRLSFTAL